MAMQGFTDFVGKTPETLILEAEDEIQKGVLPRRRRLKSYLIGFRKHMQDRGLAPVTIKGYMTGVKSFYSLFDIEVPALPRQDNRAKPLEKHCKIPTKEEIREVLKVCDPLEKALILVGSASGLSSNELVDLKINDFIKGYDKSTGIATLMLRRAKTQVDFVTFLTPEACNAVIDYLNYRGRTDKKQEVRRQKQLEKQRIFSNDGYLFIKRNISYKFLEDHNEEERKLDTPAIIKVYRLISEKAQKNTTKGDWNLIRSHNIRKYFNSVLLNAGCDSFHVEFFMGHALDDTRAAYFRASSEKLKEIYKKYIPYLTVQKELDLSESPEYQAIKSENDILRAETAKHIVERQEITALKIEVEQGKTERAELNELRNEIETLYKEMKKTKDRFNATAPLMHKLHPNRLLFPPDSDDTNVDPDCM